MKIAMPDPSRYATPPDNDNSALAWQIVQESIEAICNADPGAVKEIILVTPVKDQIKNGSLATHLGEQSATSLFKGDKIVLPSGVSCRHASLKTMGRSATDAVVVVYYADDEMLEKADGLLGPRGIVAVPWVDGDIDKWIKRWNPTIIGKAPAPAATLLSDKVVERALLALTQSVNLSKGALGPLDKRDAEEVLRILRAHGHALTPDDIKSWAIKNRWKPSAAAELGKLAAKIGKLKAKPSLSKYHKPHDRYQRWLH
ncbi:MULTISPECIES: hypothetical protein [unclassified Mesorhizobium]|uniref:hypothetical protein n=1 Tax=unclassified Mesorhizobium TaxID=325217 RepID=UPI001091F460|nr:MULTISPECIES: hypothetical protein [unclassified Mesorhizobium]TGQ43682.1 hypothetical protein EN857_06215 [Mesorhizobium sp. M4B.F.Ca.ET.214.01.1.1]TGQ62497.1 hypothetical protein EN854_06220 [Mesorhizobium sp. M4B.F.Ca.ET.211.01.1.1]TGU39699.1 hypothetical protein EN793_06215 [Mesorhizobium sp. M4B.F.Ca.ET.150.01.1.1]